MKSKEHIFYPLILIGLLVVLSFNFFVAIYEYIDYPKRVKAGNERWKQVEERIKELEVKCNGRNG